MFDILNLNFKSLNFKSQITTTVFLNKVVVIGDMNTRMGEVMEGIYRRYGIADRNGSCDKLFDPCGEQELVLGYIFKERNWLTIISEKM